MINPQRGLPCVTTTIWPRRDERIFSSKLSKVFENTSVRSTRTGARLVGLVLSARSTH